LSSFAADYDSSKTIIFAPPVICFAQEKLLCATLDRSYISPEGILACLSVLFALELEPSAPPVYNRETTLVEGHLRLCVGASRGFECLRTAAGSEPFVAEAAATIIRASRSTFAERLATHSAYGIIFDGRGVLLGSLLVMQTRDMVVWMSREWVYVREFMKALLPPDEY